MYRSPERRWERADAPLSQAMATSTVVADDAAAEDAAPAAKWPSSSSVVIEALSHVLLALQNKSHPAIAP